MAVAQSNVELGLRRASIKFGNISTAAPNRWHNGHYLDHHNWLRGGRVAKLLHYQDYNCHPGRTYEPSGFIMTTVLGIVGAFFATYLGQAPTIAPMKPALSPALYQPTGGELSHLVYSGPDQSQNTALQ
jgi:hypothetical protein